MSLNLEQKKAQVAAVSEQFNACQAAVLAEYRGLSVSQMMDLRAEARSADVIVRVMKNTLAKRAVDGSDFECLKEHFVGPLVIGASGDPVAVAKVFSNFAKKNEALKITAGVMNGKSLALDEVQALAKLPSRDELLSKLVGTMQAPVQKLVQTLNEVPSSFVRLLAAVQDGKPAAEATS